jgi:GT2 family glycosyltransferase
MNVDDDAEGPASPLSSRAPSKPRPEEPVHLNPIDLSAKFLRKPVKNMLKFSLARLMVKVPLFPERRRAKFAESAKKRDYRWLSQKLLEASASQELRTLHQALPPFNGEIQRKRREAVESTWHAAINRALFDTDLDVLPKVTVSFVTYNSARWLDDLFTSLLAQNYPASKLNISFLDNGSTDETIDKITKFIENHEADFASVSLRKQDNLGFGAGHDVSFKASEDDLVFVSNVDLQFHKDSLVKAVKVALADQDDVASWELRQCPYEHPKFYDPISLETSWSSHACILIRRSAYEKVGGYEERIFMYGEDVELSFRFRGAGFRIRYLPQVTVTHHVDFKDTKLRPDQFAGSISSNILLRHRYGTPEMAREGVQMLESLIANEIDRNRRNGLVKAKEIVMNNRQHFQKTKQPEAKVHFPFNGFDYEVGKLGFDTPLQSEVPLDGPLVSIVTRTHGPNTQILAEAILSVCNQTYQNIEHLIIEDRTNFAEDLTENLRAAYAKNIRYIKSEGHGRSAAGNTGLDRARGQFMMFLDNDDLLLADHVEILVRGLMANATAPAAYALAWEIPTFYDQSGRYREGTPVSVYSHATPFSRKKLRKINFLPIQCVLFRRELYETFGGFDMEIDHLEDWNLWCRYSSAGDFHYVPKTTSLYRVPGDYNFRSERTRVMLAAEEAVHKKNAAHFESQNWKKP